MINYLRNCPSIPFCSDQNEDDADLNKVTTVAVCALEGGENPAPVNAHRCSVKRILFYSYYAGCSLGMFGTFLYFLIKSEKYGSIGQ